MTDHGNSSGSEFFAKLVIYATKFLPSDDSWSLNFFCLDIMLCGHLAEEEANAIKKSLQRLGLTEAEIKPCLITGDSGGGAAIFRLHPLVGKTFGYES
jgi:hypothetical protein